jgi:hypothetical protein
MEVDDDELSFQGQGGSNLRSIARRQAIQTKALKATLRTRNLLAPGHDREALVCGPNRVAVFLG